MASKYNGKILRKRICLELGIEKSEYENFICNLYKEGLSGGEISEYILRETGEVISARSVQRVVKDWGLSRGIGDAFRNAMSKGRVTWQLEENKKRREGARHQLPRGLRYSIIQRDGAKCTLCGAKELLQVDHIIARVHGGTDEESNLRTLCIDCNLGKRIVEKEMRFIGGFAGSA